jgi:hypothetical protein
MALKLKIELESGIVVDGSYCRVENISLRNKNNLAIVVSMYKDTNKPAFDRKNFVGQYDLNGGNVLAQAYEHLKTLPEFANAEDC